MTTEHSDEKKPAVYGQSGAGTSASELQHLQLKPMTGTFNSVFEVLDDGATVGAISWKQLADLTVHQLAQRAPPCIQLKGEGALVVYERRTAMGSAGSEDAISLEIGEEKIALSASAARDLARVLLAYSEPDNRRSQWLVRKESG